MSISTEVMIAIVFGVPSLVVAIASAVFAYISTTQARRRRPTEDAEMPPLAISYFPAIYPDGTNHFFRNFHDTRAGGPWPPSHFNVAGGYHWPGRPQW
ncbi:hypothetical protein RB213_013721 [Colletotrichum asianum]